MIAKILLFCAAVAAVQSTYIGAPGILNAGLLGPAAVKTASVVAIPGAVTTDKRVIGAGVLAAAPIAHGIYAPGIVANGVIANSLIANGLLRGAPLGVLSPLGLKGAGIIGAPGLYKTIY